MSIAVQIGNSHEIYREPDWIAFETFITTLLSLWIIWIISPLGIYTINVRKASGSDKHVEKVFTFGLDKATAARPWRENRLTCAPTETYVYVGDRGEPLRAEIHNVSRSGLRLVLEQPVPVGSAVKVEMAGMIAVGEIRYCRQDKGDSFSAGMRIDTIQKRV
jgi:hypothetical protein